MKMKQQRKKLQHLDLFSGIGGFSLGLETAGLAETVAFCDIEDYCQKVLNKHWPHVPIFSDIKELNYETLRAKGINNIDIITGGYPCQPFSVAGRKKGEQDPRHLWPEYFRLIKELRPTWVIGENVSGHIKQGLDTVLENLESEGYSTRTFSISASSIGANHKRERVWILAHSGRSLREGSKLGRENENEIKKENANQFERSSSTSQSNVAYSDSERLERYGREYELREDSKKGKVSRSSENVADSERIRQQGQGKSIGSGNTKTYQNGEASWTFDGSQGKEGWWDVEPDVGRVAHGVPKRVDRLKSLGNSLVPQIPFLIANCIKQIEGV
jgi:DNA (cytosine-5)-methyltransferase 1